MGVDLQGQGLASTAPLEITSPLKLQAIDYHVPVASAQVKSAILLAGLSAYGETRVHEDVRTRRTTEDMLRSAGVEVTSEDVGAGSRRASGAGSARTPQLAYSLAIRPKRRSSRCWAPSISDATLEVLSVDASDERVGFVGVLDRMGADVRLDDREGFHVLHARSSSLVATEIHSNDVPSVDEVPVLAVAACAASGVSAFREMDELRHKESDRFAGSMSLAMSLGCRVWSEGDDFFIEGLGSAEKFLQFTFHGALDHRMVMASAIAGCAGNGATIRGAATVSSSYPHFFRDLALLQ